MQREGCGRRLPPPCIWSWTRGDDTGLAMDNPKWDIRRQRMKRRITVAEVQAALDGFVQAGLVCEFAATPSESAADEAELEFHRTNRKRRRRRYGTRERALIKQVIEE